MIYRITFGFSGAGQGWGETHAMLNASNNPKDLAPTLEDIAQKRVAFLGREFAIVGIRIARYATDAGVRARGVYLDKKTFRNPNQTQAYAAEPSDVAYLVRGSAEPSVLNPQFNANQNQTFLGGPLDATVDNAGEVDTGKSGLLAAFNSWKSAMLGTTMGWLASETIAEADIQSAVGQINGKVLLTVDAAQIAALVQGQKYRGRIRQVNQGVSPLNGEILVTKKSATTLETYETIGLALPQTGGAIRLYKPVQPFVDYGDLQLADHSAQHKRGRPFGTSPGRAKKRIRG